jgi:effector-binding domain-containing protein
MSALAMKFVPALIALGLLVGQPAFAQTAPAPAPAATPSPAASASPAATPSPTASPAVTPSPALAPPPDHSNAAGDLVELSARPTAYFEGRANRDEVYSSIMGSIAMLRNEVTKANLKTVGNPLAVFLEADDEGFRYRAEIPLAEPPANGATQLAPTVKVGATPAGKAMRFEHRGAYDDIDATYEAITAYLDEKSIDAQDVFLEEYLNDKDIKTSDDPNLQVDIYVLIK